MTRDEIIEEVLMERLSQKTVYFSKPSPRDKWIENALLHCCSILYGDLVVLPITDSPSPP